MIYGVARGVKKCRHYIKLTFKSISQVITSMARMETMIQVVSGKPVKTKTTIIKRKQ